MAQIINITSEALQATIRRLLPSQQGFGEDLQASNVIQPVIDITATAEGSQLPTDLSRALNFGGATTFAAFGSSATLMNTPGFWRVTGNLSVFPFAGSGAEDAAFRITNALTIKDLIRVRYIATTSTSTTYSIDEIFFMDTGDVMTAEIGANGALSGSYRQVADRYGNLINPVGFTFE